MPLHLRKKTNTAISQYTYIPISPAVLPPGQPTVERAGPLFPALETNTMLCLEHISKSISRIALCKKKQSEIGKANNFMITLVSILL